MRIDGPRTKFFLFGVGFLASNILLVSILWPKYGPTVAVLAGFILVALFGWLMQRLELNSTLNKDRDISETKTRMMTWPMGVAWIVAMISWFPGAEIESAALKQPDRPTTEFSQPMHLKGVVRYVTPTQLRISEITRWTFFGGIAVFVGIGFLQDRKRKKKPTL